MTEPPHLDYARPDTGTPAEEARRRRVDLEDRVILILFWSSIGSFLLLFGLVALR